MSQHVHRNIQYLCFVDTFDVGGREVSVDLIDVLLVHVLRHTVLIEVVHHVGARQHAVHLKPNIFIRIDSNDQSSYYDIYSSRDR